MPFSFTFKLSVPGLSNPFSRTALPAPPTPASDSKFDRMQKITRRRPSPALTYPTEAPLSRKRGWEPTFAEPSRSTATLTSSSGYLNTPAQYRIMARGSANDFHEAEVIDSDTEMPPPTKRRRGLAGSIVSTAINAALIGTAVGLTVYRLWRDRGKEAERLPPPPYQQGEWSPEPAPPLQITPATPRSKKSRHTIASTSKRPISHRRTRTRTYALPQPTPPRTTSTSPTLFPPPQPEFNFDPEPIEPDVVEDQMDWIGDKLSMLIEEGKKALNREVVVMSDAKEDEVDDGSGAWEEEHTPSASVSRSSSLKRSKRPRSIAPTPYHTHTLLTPSPSPRKAGFDLPMSISSPQMITPKRTHSRGISLESGVSYTPSTSFREDERAWESPELRESMEKARARLLRNRGS